MNTFTHCPPFFPSVCRLMNILITLSSSGWILHSAPIYQGYTQSWESNKFSLTLSKTMLLERGWCPFKIYSTNILIHYLPIFIYKSRFIHSFIKVYFWEGRCLLQYTGCAPNKQNSTHFPRWKHTLLLFMWSREPFNLFLIDIPNVNDFTVY
jgi:hypothetical protein